MNGYNVGTKVLKSNSQEMNESEIDNTIESPKRYRCGFIIFKKLILFSNVFLLVFIGIMPYR
jgi:hypothetical protein